MKEDENLTMTGQEAGFLAGMQKAESMMKRRPGYPSRSPLSLACSRMGLTMRSKTVLRMVEAVTYRKNMII